MKSDRHPEIRRRRHIYNAVNGEELALEVFTAGEADGSAARPALLLIHGGGWAFGSPEEFREVAERYAAMGLVAVTVGYRLSRNPDDSFPRPGVSPIESVQDVRSAMRWLRKHADDLGIDAERIVAMGQSAGGQLALSTVLVDGMDNPGDDLSVSPEPAAIILLSSCVNTLEAWIDNLLQERRDRIWDISPHHQARAGMPPILAFHGDADKTVAMYSIRLFQQRMRELGNEYRLETLPGRDHYLGGPRDGQYAGYLDDGILDRIDGFLRERDFL